MSHVSILIRDKHAPNILVLRWRRDGHVQYLGMSGSTRHLDVVTNLLGAVLQLGLLASSVRPVVV